MLLWCQSIDGCKGKVTQFKSDYPNVSCPVLLRIKLQFDVAGQTCILAVEFL